jgi:hypothetical protein
MSSWKKLLRQLLRKEIKMVNEMRDELTSGKSFDELLNEKHQTEAIKHWLSNPPKKCDICDTRLKDVTMFVDGQTVFSRWAIMCPKCFDEVGLGLGPALGQLYSTKTLKKLKG